jgi:8-oxo-dGTP pyrophosphatase MutT (NUDIX family)
MVQDEKREATGRGAVAIVTNPAGDVLLQLRDDIDGIVHPGHWSLPGGGVEPGEDTTGAVLRELAEETGLRCALVRHLFEVTDERSVGGSGHLISVFHTTHTGPADELVLGEGQALRYFPPHRLPEPMTLFAREAIDRFRTI